MNRRVRQAVMRIMLLTDEFSSEELTEAVALIGGQKDEDLLSFVKRLSPSPRRASESRSSESHGARGESRALQDLKAVGGEKYEVLRDFERALREGSLLKTLDDFRAFGKHLEKAFTPGKSRIQALGRLMAILVTMDLDSIKTAIAKTPSRSSEGDDSYRRLANQIMSGSTDRSTEGSH
jgi:hypothetical protein